MTVFFHIDSTLQQLLQEQTLVLTPNRRMAMHIRAAYDEKKSSANTIWPVPRLYAIDDWLYTQWQALQDRGLTRATACLTPLQEQALWQDIISHDQNLQGFLLPTTSLAKQAASSYRLLQRWQIPLQRLTDIKVGEEIPSAAALKRWSQNFQKRCRTQNFTSASHLSAELQQAYSESLLPHENSITLCGFEDMPPAYLALLQSATHRIANINPITGHARQQQQTTLADSDSEITAFAFWAKNILQTADDKNAVQIGLVVPDLSSRRPQIERLLLQVLDPQHALPQQEAAVAPINFSAGTSLADTPVILAAMSLLALLHRQWPLQNLLQILHSPFWGDWPADMHERAQTEHCWREVQRFTLDSHYALHRLSPHTQTAALHARLQGINPQILNLKDNKLPSQWSLVFSNSLHALGWPGTRRLNSLEYQQVEHWQRCLQQLSSLDIVIGNCSLDTALQWLREAVQAHNFQAQSAPSPIQVLGVLEASGLHFTHLWISGMHRNAWPPAPSPDPLLPLWLQRQHNMPHASGEREWLYARHLSEHFAQCTQQLVCSYAKHAGDCEQQLSELWSHLPTTEHTVPVCTLTPETLERLAIDGAPPVSSDEQVAGGFGILKMQIINPFNAFARYRLGVDTAKEPVSGISAMERGNLLHAVLEDFWHDVKNLQALRNMGGDTQQQKLDQQANTHIEKLIRQKPDLQHALYIEKQRLLRLLEQWLEEERRREDFVVAGIEEKLPLQLAGLPLQLRIDRIDKLTNGKHLLIDYKTGATLLKRTDWATDSAEEAPLEPQLPLYAAFYPDSCGIAWAQIHTKKAAWTSLGTSSDIPGLSTSKTDWQQSEAQWQQQLQRWRRALETVADHFMQGITPVTLGGSPERSWQALNRIPEAAELWLDDGEGDDAA